MDPITPDTVLAAWCGPFDAETPFGTITQGDTLTITREQACGGHWVDPATGEPFLPVEPAAASPADQGLVHEPLGAAAPEGQTLTASDDAGADSVGEEPI